MVKFELYGKTLLLDTKKCFKPNLTTQLILRSVIKMTRENTSKFKSVLELGCGTGVISAYLAKYGYLKNVSQLSLSDISIEAVSASQSNFTKNVGRSTNFELTFKSGKGLNPWSGNTFDLIINDISAISDEIAGLSDWFDCATCEAGRDGIDNTLEIIHRGEEFLNNGGTLIFPVLSLCNVKKLDDILFKKGYKTSLLQKQKWPLPSSMLKTHKSRLLMMKKNGYINFEEKFGQFIAETRCYALNL
ncbi:MAG: methyltransferase [Paracoccaceae bacterium]